MQKQNNKKKTNQGFELIMKFVKTPPAYNYHKHKC